MVELQTREDGGQEEEPLHQGRGALRMDRPLPGGDVASRAHSRRYEVSRSGAHSESNHLGHTRQRISHLARRAVCEHVKPQGETSRNEPVV